MPSLIVSTIAFFVSGYYVKRYLDDNDIPKGMTRNAFVFAVALAISYGAALAVDWLVG